jgi:hypothetical protein
VDAKADVGLLFVHGIGEQERGATVSAWTDTLVGALREALGDDAVEVRAAVLGPDPSDASAPAHVDLDIVLPDAPAVVRWRLAEGWWAETFSPPGFAELAWWAVFVLPYTLLAHFVLRFQSARHQGRSVAYRGVALTRAGLLVALAALLLPLLAVVVALIVVLGAVPIAAIRRLAGALQRRLSQTFGDSFVFLGSPARAGAIVDKVARDARWLSECTSRQIVVAHSQGAEVAFRALRRQQPTTLERFITLGSGQTKLSMIERAVRSGEQRGVWLAPLGFLVIAASLVSAQRWIAREGWDEAWAWLIYVSVGVSMVAVGIGHASAVWRKSPSELDVHATNGWLDLYATHDPVAGGSVYGLRGHSRLLISEPVANQMSTVRDHTAYRSNVEGVVARIATAAACATGGSLYAAGLRRRVGARALRRRAWRVQWLRACRWYALLVGAFLVVAQGDRLADTGRDVTPALSAVLSLLPVLSIPDRADDRSDVATAAALLMFGLSAWLVYVILAAIWRWWDGNEMRAALRPPNPYLPELDRYVLWNLEFVVLLETMVGVALTAVVVGSDRDIGVNDVGGAAEVVTLPLVPVGILILSFFIAPLFFALMWPLTFTRLVRSDRVSPSVRQQAAVLVPYVIALIALAVFDTSLPSNPWWLGIGILGPWLLAYVVTPIVSSSEFVDRVLEPLRRAASAPPRRQPPVGTIARQRLRLALQRDVVPALRAWAAEPGDDSRARVTASLRRATTSVRRDQLAGDERKQLDAVTKAWRDGDAGMALADAVVLEGIAETRLTTTSTDRVRQRVREFRTALTARRGRPS